MARQILVIGAGIAGLATAVALQRRGHEVTVIEERTDTSSGAGISIWPNALAALDEIGLGDAVRDAGGRRARCAGATAPGCAILPTTGWSQRSVSRWW